MLILSRTTLLILVDQTIIIKVVLVLFQGDKAVTVNLFKNISIFGEVLSIYIYVRQSIICFYIHT